VVDTWTAAAFEPLAPLFYRFPQPTPRDYHPAVNVNLGIWNKLTGVVVFLCFIAVILLVGVWYLPLIQQNARMRKVILRLDEQIQKEEEAGKQLHSALDSLKNNPKAVERLAREKFGYAKPGETVIHFEESPTNDPVQR
jgi:cell division protein FtsB